MEREKSRYFDQPICNRRDINWVSIRHEDNKKIWRYYIEKCWKLQNINYFRWQWSKNNKIYKRLIKKCEIALDLKIQKDKAWGPTENY